MSTRSTRQRQAICRCFARAGRPLSHAEVLEAARRDLPKLGQATVYRTVKALVAEGVLSPVALPGEPDRYEEAGKQHHHHFRCRRCHGVYEIAGCPGHMKGLLPRGFQLEGHELVLFGLCARCA